ncbi:MAG: 16S rRNA (adenine(1518)-N(6)/adenine(1519)-N(6))-dimethyltransferase RsmA [Candidatus Dasytiphilus stammeri]
MFNKKNICYGHLAKKRFGQHFLKNKKIINNIVGFIQPQNNQEMVEIGPGLGFLTSEISKYVQHMTTIELDHNLVNRLQDNTVLNPKLKIYNQDVMTFDFNQLSQQQGKKLRIFGTLPYNISTPLLFYLFNYKNVIKDMHFVLQKEVVNRIIAKPGNKNYGRLSVMSQYYCKGISLLEIPPKSFIPSPKVFSVLIRLIPHITMPNIVHNIYALNYVTRIAFSQRRKMLRNSLRKVFTEDIINEIGIDPTLRAENISLTFYCHLANLLSNNFSKKI